MSTSPRLSAQPQRPHIISALVNGRLVPGPVWQKRQYRFKFLLRSLLFYPSTRRMLDSLACRPDFEQMLQAQVTLPGKSHRQYLTRGMNARQRAEAIVSHYQFIDSLAGRPFADALSSAERQLLLQFQGKDAATFSVYASCASKAEREGESTLWLYDEQQTLLASITFSVVHEQDGWSLMVGGLQGPRRDVPHDVIRLATRACYGLFPKRVLMEVLWQFAALTNITSLYGVSDRGHVFRALRYRLSKGRHFHASYDEFWTAVDGVKKGPWRWQLPAQMPRKSLESIASKKRAEYRRRFELLDDLQAQIVSLCTAVA